MSNSFGHGDPKYPQRRYLSDDDIMALTQDQADDLMAECDYEPADPEICDACAAYMLRT